MLPNASLPASLAGLLAVLESCFTRVPSKTEPANFVALDVNQHEDQAGRAAPPHPMSRISRPRVP